MSIANDILETVDFSSGINQNYRLTSTWYDGSVMTDAKCDGDIYRKNTNGYWVKTINKDELLKIVNIENLRAKNGYYEGQEISLLGYYGSGDKKPLTYKFTVQNFNTLVDDGGAIIKSSKGSWIAQFNNSVNSADFGVKGDGIIDDWLSLQSAVEYCLNNKLDLKLQNGRIRISKSILIGHFVSGKYVKNGVYFTFKMYGQIQPYKGENFTGTTIICDFADRMGISVQGARKVVLRDFSLIGKLNSFFETQQHLASAIPTFQDTVFENWFDPAIGDASTLLKRYAPYAGICVDGYSGTKQATFYPDYNGTSLYGVTAPSNRVLTKGVYIAGFAVGVCYNPSAVDNNGDFMDIEDCTISNGIYGFSCNATQGRQMSIRNTTVARFYTAFTNNKFGAQRGTIDASWNNIYVAYCVNVFELDSTWIRTFIINQLSGELLYNFGIIGSNGGTAGEMIINSCNLSLTARSVQRGATANFLQKIGSGIDMPIVFNSAQFLGSAGVLYFGFNCILNSVSMTPASYPDYSNLITQPYFRAFNNVYKHLIKGTLDRNTNDIIGQNNLIDISTGVSTPIRNQPINSSSRNTFISFYNNFVKGNLGVSAIQNHYNRTVITGSNLGTTSWQNLPNALKLNVTYPGGNRGVDRQAADGFGVGDVVFANTSKMVFVVESYDLVTFQAVWRALNNYKSDGTNLQLLESVNVATDNFYSQSGRHYMPESDTYFDSTSGNNLLTNVTDSFTTTVKVPANVVASDIIFFPRYQGRIFSENGGTINSIDATARTFTISQTAKATTNGTFLGKLVRVL